MALAPSLLNENLRHGRHDVSGRVLEDPLADRVMLIAIRDVLPLLRRAETAPFSATHYDESPSQVCHLESTASPMLRQVSSAPQIARPSFRRASKTSLSRVQSEAKMSPDPTPGSCSLRRCSSARLATSLLEPRFTCKRNST